MACTPEAKKARTVANAEVLNQAPITNEWEEEWLQRDRRLTHSGESNLRTQLSPVVFDDYVSAPSAKTNGPDRSPPAISQVLVRYTKNSGKYMVKSPNLRQYHE